MVMSGRYEKPSTQEVWHGRDERYRQPSAKLPGRPTHEPVRTAGVLEMLLCIMHVLTPDALEEAPSSGLTSDRQPFVPNSPLPR